MSRQNLWTNKLLAKSVLDVKVTTMNRTAKKVFVPRDPARSSHKSCASALTWPHWPNGSSGPNFLLKLQPFHLNDSCNSLFESFWIHIPLGQATPVLRTTPWSHGDVFEHFASTSAPDESALHVRHGQGVTGHHKVRQKDTHRTHRWHPARQRRYDPSPGWSWPWLPLQKQEKIKMFPQRTMENILELESSVNLLYHIHSYSIVTSLLRSSSIWFYLAT